MQRWAKTATTSKSTGKIPFNMKQLKGQQPPTAAEIDKAEYCVDTDKTPFLLYWAEDAPINQTPVMLFYPSSVSVVHSGSALILSQRFAVKHLQTTYEEALKILSTLPPQD